MLQALPPEILDQLCAVLPQQELLRLAYTCKAIHAVAHKHLFSEIVIDSSKRHMCDDGASDMGVYTDASLAPVRPVTVRSLYSLSKLLKTLAQPEIARHVRRIVAQRAIPDIPDIRLGQLMGLAMPLLVNLQVFNWYLLDKPFPADLLSLVPSAGLVSVCGNFNFLFLTASKLWLHDAPALRFLDLSNLQSGKALLYIDLAQFPLLQHLTVSKYPARNAQPLLGSDAFEVAGQASFVELLFAGLRRKLRLKTLVLRDLVLQPLDAPILLDALDTRALEVLCIDGCVENLFANENQLPLEVQLTRRHPPAESFLAFLQGELSSLKALSLDLANELYSYSSAYKLIGSMRGLRSLEFKIKVSSPLLPVPLEKLFGALKKHHLTLEVLNIDCEVAGNSSLCGRTDPKIALASLQGLKHFPKLVSVDLPISSQSVASLAPYFTSPHLKSIYLTITDKASSPASCEGCVVPQLLTLVNTNCLVAQEYFSCPESYGYSVEQTMHDQYAAVSQAFERKLPSLHSIRFNVQGSSLHYKKSNSARMVLI